MSNKCIIVLQVSNILLSLHEVCRSLDTRLLWLRTSTAAESYNFCGYMTKFRPAFTVAMYYSRLPHLLWLHAAAESHIYYDYMPEISHTFTVDVCSS
jgi:hypothetical protein